MNKLKQKQRTLKQLGWKIYKKRRHEIIYSKHNNNTLIILNRDSECVSFKDVHSLTFEEMEAIKMAHLEFFIGEFIKREIKDNRKQIEVDKKRLAEKIWNEQRMKGLIGR